jgi:hypothetical protein
MAATGVNCGVLIETKITNDKYTHLSLGYNVFALNAISVWQGGNALFWRDIDLYEIKESKIFNPNVLSLELPMGKMCFYVVGTYLLPSDPGTHTPLWQSIHFDTRVLDSVALPSHQYKPKFWE